MELVHCCDCNHLKECSFSYYEYSTYECHHPNNCIEKHTWHQKWFTPKKHPKKINKHNNCQWFEKKEEKK